MEHSTPSMSSDGSSGDLDSAEEIDFNLLDLDVDAQEVVEVNDEGEEIISLFNVCVSDMDTGNNLDCAPLAMSARAIGFA